MSEVMDTWIIWLVAACVLLLIEVLSQTVWAFCFAAGCLVALLLSLFTDSLAVQGIAVAVAAIAAWLLLAPVVRRWERRNERQTRTGMDALLGRRATVTEEIRPGHTGRARIDGDNWQVVAPAIDTPIHAGEEVVVTAYDSIILTVKPI